jgi:putative restriction endonuclease
VRAGRCRGGGHGDFLRLACPGHKRLAEPRHIGTVEEFAPVPDNHHVASERVDARAFLEGLRGRELWTLSRDMPNRVLDVTAENAIVATETSPDGEGVPIAEVQRALDRLFTERELAVSIRGLESHRSSFIGAALATLPAVEVVGERPKVLRLRARDPVAEELSNRLAMWKALQERGGPTDVPKRLIRELGIYGGAQGVWVDAERTRSISADGTGVAVGLLHTGRHYADDLSPTGILYHYPRTNRGRGRDAAEIEATKKAGSLALPVFVVTPSRRSTQRRDVHLGWVAQWNDEDELFLVTFTDDVSADASPSPREFKLLDEDPGRRLVALRARPNQQRFKFDVLARYGAACAVCDLDVPEVLDAVHIVDKGKLGTDDPANGLVLCATHHRAFDRGLFCIEPAGGEVNIKVKTSDLRMTRTSLDHLKALPHPDALEWRWSRWSGSDATAGSPP